MKQVKYFIDFVELRTKVVSVFPFLIATLYYHSHFKDVNNFNYLNVAIFFCAMLCFDMFTTSLNHYVAFYREKNISVYDANLLSEMDNNDYNMKINLRIMAALFISALVLGIWLVYRSNIAVLLLGMLSFLVGISYSYGPKPIAYTPVGELFAGAFMGVVLPIITIFIHYDHIPWELHVFMAVIFMPLAFLIGSILFANNVCDVEMDVSNQRFTLGYYIKGKWAIRCLYLSNLGTMASLALSVYWGYLKPDYLVLLILIIPLSYNVYRFSLKVSKAESFPYIVKNFVMFSFFYALAIIFFQ
ncbi:MAG: prenyltransferase [Bacilli bacterium]